MDRRERCVRRMRVSSDRYFDVSICWGSLNVQGRRIVYGGCFFARVLERANLGMSVRVITIINTSHQRGDAPWTVE